MPTLPAYPLNEQITQALLAALQQVTVANGYHVDLVPQRRVRKGNTPGPYVAVLNDGHDREPEPKPPYTDGNGTGDAPYGTQQWLRYYELDVYVFDSDDDPSAPIEQLCNIARADAEYALAVDKQLGGLAIDLFPRDPAYIMNANDIAGITVTFDVQYRTLENDPFTRA